MILGATYFESFNGLKSALVVDGNDFWREIFTI